MTNLLDASTFIDPGEIADFTANLLEASTEYSIIGEDLDGRILLFNVGARRHYGYESSEVVGKLSDILHAPADVAAGLPAAMRAAALADGKWEGAVLRKRKDGSAFTARVVLTPRHNAAGKPIGYLLISKDISSEIRLTEELEATQFYTRSLIESNIDALMTTDPVGAITDVNQQMEWLTGRTRGELIGSPAGGEGHQLRAHRPGQGRPRDRGVLQRDDVQRPRGQAAGRVRRRPRRHRAQGA
jgi:PAS domain S-box-containing protein